MSKTYSWHWTGVFFHIECMPEEAKLQEAAMKLGKKPEKLNEGEWLVELTNRKRRIMSEWFPNTRTYVCSACKGVKASGKELHTE